MSDLMPTGSDQLVVGLTLLVWGVIELLFRLRLLLRPGINARLRRGSPTAGRRWWDWTFPVLVASLTVAVILAVRVTACRGAAVGAGWPMTAVGEVMMLAGITLRVWAMVVLGRFFTFVVGISADQPVVRDGPYRVVRHPGYAGALLVLLGFGIAQANWLSVLLMLIVPPLAMAVRIRAEEATLIAALGEEYVAYMRTTAGLIPGVW
jgi:protein-S-isoprenylcysteine O-methyltransferase Ste14